jgi:PEP-CTERM motif
MNTFKKIAAVAVLGLVALAPAHATLLTSNTLSGTTVIDFSDQPNQSGTFGAVQIGTLVGQNVTVASSSNSNGLYFNYNGWVLGDNGYWGNGKTYVSLNDSNDSMLFAFNDGPVSAVGGFLNYAVSSLLPTQDLIITALDSSMAVLESYDLTTLANIITPSGVNEGAFRGIQRGTSDIAYFQISGGLANALDDLTFISGATTVPEPGTLFLFGLALAGLGIARRKKA